MNARKRFIIVLTVIALLLACIPGAQADRLRPSRVRRPNLADFQRELQRIGGDNLVAYWPLDDKSGTTARDIGPNGEVLDIVSTTLGQNGPPGLGRSHYFDGINDVDSQHIYDDEQGNLSFVADGGSAEFRDDGQDFGDWATTPTATAAYMLVVISDNGTSWGYMGADNNGGQDIDIYSDRGLTMRGWNGRTTPNGSGDTPASYEVRKTLFQITGAYTLGLFIKTTDAAGVIMGKAFNGSRAMYFYLNDGKMTNIMYSPAQATQAYCVTADTYNDGVWHLIIITYVPSTSLMTYVDGVMRASDTSSVPASINDEYSVMRLGARGNDSDYTSGNISHVFVINRSLSAAEVHRLWQIGSHAHTGYWVPNWPIRSELFAMQPIKVAHAGGY